MPFYLGGGYAFNKTLSPQFHLGWRICDQTFHFLRSKYVVMIFFGTFFLGFCESTFFLVTFRAFFEDRFVVFKVTDFIFLFAKFLG